MRLHFPTQPSALTPEPGALFLDNSTEGRPHGGPSRCAQTLVVQSPKGWRPLADKSQPSLFSVAGICRGSTCPIFVCSRLVLGKILSHRYASDRYAVLGLGLLHELVRLS